jgi:hypothetical protein
MAINMFTIHQNCDFPMVPIQKCQAIHLAHNPHDFPTDTDYDRDRDNSMQPHTDQLHNDEIMTALIKNDIAMNLFTICLGKLNYWTPASPSSNAQEGNMSLIPRFGNSIISAFNIHVHEGNDLKFGPHSGNINFVNKYATLNAPIYKALQ